MDFGLPWTLPVSYTYVKHSHSFAILFVEGNFVDRQTINIGQLASMVHGQTYGPSDTTITSAAPLYEVSLGQITFVDDPKQASELAGKASALVVKHYIQDCLLPQIVVDDPRAAFGEIVQYFLDQAANEQETRQSHPIKDDDQAANLSAHRQKNTEASPDAVKQTAEIASTASVHPSSTIGLGAIIEHGVTIGRRVTIGASVHLMAGVVVMDDTKLGDNCVVFPNVTFYPRTRVGNNVTIHAGTVLGAYGFGYKSSGAGHQRTPQLGYVIIEDEVEIGACVTIDRGTFGSTRIGYGTKIDNQVMIGHNCQIGKHNLLCSQVGIAGSCKTGDFVVLAGQVGLKDHITLGDHAVVGAQAGVMEDLPGGQVYLGSPATSQREQMQIMAVQRRLPELRRTVKQLERNLPPRAEERAA